MSLEPFAYSHCQTHLFYLKSHCAFFGMCTDVDAISNGFFCPKLAIIAML